MSIPRESLEERFEVPHRLTRALDSKPVDDARRCLVRVYEFIIQKGDRNQFAEIQTMIECNIFGLTPDRRRSQYNHIDRYKILVYISNFLNFEVLDERTRDAIFNFVFLSANKDSPAYYQRIGFLVTGCQLCVQYPAKKLLDCTATWLLQDLPTQLDGETIIQKILEMFIFTGNKNTIKCVEKLRETSFTFAVVLFYFSITETNFNNEDKAANLALLLGKWLITKTCEFTDVIIRSKFMSTNFSLTKLQILVKYCVTNPIPGNDHDRFQIGVLKLVDISRQIFFPINLGFIKDIQLDTLNDVAIERFEECAYAFVNWGLVVKEELSADMQKTLTECL